ncbi:MAG: hypothetical protein A2474_00910 [Elusimicrobia bacterium RIFOXYC2_FULL_34_12]|nr:MAG: hypothetical protein A2474_00910 [Elusimicrobia bacterium RIFOXYC2_FULL_34_12]OGS38882.1 MAG: hypothetical protein A2551_03400 [Elusimicrobia bacterium RIFOXYD2_FULL_34_30]HAM39046.1 hypothetical protein [Elusimicrobiota bacterium]
MKLIKNFKINLRQGYIFRDLKKQKFDISEDLLSEKLNEIQKNIKPATVYDSFKPDVFRGYFDLGKSIAVSLFTVTLGKDVELLEKNEIIKSSLSDGLDVAKCFTIKLIEIEAEKEHCEIVEPLEIEPPKIFENYKILKSMDFSKIGVRFEYNKISPEYTKFFACNWLLRKKK